MYSLRIRSQPWPGKRFTTWSTCLSRLLIEIQSGARSHKPRAPTRTYAQKGRKRPEPPWIRPEPRSLERAGCRGSGNTPAHATPEEWPLNALRSRPSTVLDERAAEIEDDVCEETHRVSARLRDRRSS